MDFYHVLNRGVEKRNVVMNDDDRMRFVRGLYLFNDKNNAPNATSQRNITINSRYKRELLVDIHAWCLMDNHYHLLISPKDDDPTNISLFMKKINMGYAKFFNEKYTRSGCLWQGKYKKILIERDAQFEYIPYYIHLNPLDKKFKGWRSGQVSNIVNCMETLNSYKWSSFIDYNKAVNFPSIITTSFFGKILQSQSHQATIIKQIIADLQSNKLVDTVNLGHPMS